MPEPEDDPRRAILSAVADGTLSPQEAAERLHALAHPHGAPEADAKASAPSSPDREGPVRVRVQASARKVEVIGDPTVREAVAEGPHEAWRDGDTLVIEGEFDPDRHFREHIGASGFSFSRSRSAVMIGKQLALVVRMNPDLALEARVEAGSLTTTGVHGPIRAHVAAGSARFDGFEGPLDVDVAAGGIKGRGRLDHGESRIRCDAGSVKLQLQRGSSVRITGEAHLGKVDLLGHQSSGVLNDSTSVTVGDGAATLDIECNLGSVKVSSDG
ncbi:MAG: hypothetical protein QOE35_2807 [Actinomycetota bacterium]|jgi:hypothetical protein